jgi:hypothetical protein
MCPCIYGCSWSAADHRQPGTHGIGADRLMDQGGQHAASWTATLAVRISNKERVSTFLNKKNYLELAGLFFKCWTFFFLASYSTLFLKKISYTIFIDSYIPKPLEAVALAPHLVITVPEASLSGDFMSLFAIHLDFRNNAEEFYPHETLSISMKHLSSLSSLI